MKFLVLLLVLGVAWLLWRNARVDRRKADAAPPAKGAAADATPQEMIRCAACAMHLPRSEALADARGKLYCSQEHRLLGDAGER
jgi:uncharacterized protein